MFFASAILAFACGSKVDYPPPSYEKASLPDWEAPPPPEDPLDSLSLEGEWVEEPSDSDAPSELKNAGPTESKTVPPIEVKAAQDDSAPADEAKEDTSVTPEDGEVRPESSAEGGASPP